MVRTLIFHTDEYENIPWYMLDNELYTIEQVVYDEEYDVVLAGTTEYFVYLVG